MIEFLTSSNDELEDYVSNVGLLPAVLPQPVASFCMSHTILLLSSIDYPQASLCWFVRKFSWILFGYCGLRQLPSTLVFPLGIFPKLFNKIQ